MKSLRARSDPYGSGSVAGLSLNQRRVRGRKSDTSPNADGVTRKTHTIRLMMGISHLSGAISGGTKLTRNDGCDHQARRPRPASRGHQTEPDDDTEEDRYRDDLELSRRGSIEGLLKDQREDTEGRKE